MSAAAVKAELMQQTPQEYAKLQLVLAKISSDLAMLKDYDTLIKDVLAHRAHCVRLFLGWYVDGQAGRVVHIPAKDYKWTQLPQYNAQLRASQADLSWEGACSDLQSVHDDCLR